MRGCFATHARHIECPGKGSPKLHRNEHRALALSPDPGRQAPNELRDLLLAETFQTQFFHLATDRGSRGFQNRDRFLLCCVEKYFEQGSAICAAFVRLILLPALE